MTIETILNSDMSVAYITDCATSPVKDQYWLDHFDDLATIMEWFLHFLPYRTCFRLAFTPQQDVVDLVNVNRCMSKTSCEFKYLANASQARL
jgi:hypothetical protein